MSHDRQDVRGEGRKASNFNEAEARKEGGGGGGAGGVGSGDHKGRPDTSPLRKMT